MHRSFYSDLFKDNVGFVVTISPSNRRINGRSAAHVTAANTWSEEVVFDKVVLFDSSKIVKHSHQMSAAILKAATGDSGVCTSTLSWCEKDGIFCSDYACMNVKKIVDTPGKKFALSYHTKAPMLFFSQEIGESSELCSVDLKSEKQRIHFSYPGLNMQFSLSKDGKKGATCMSGDAGNTELYLYDQAECNRQKKTVFTKLTENNGTNSSPCFLLDDNLVFCSDFETGKNGKPQIYHFDIKTKKTARLTDGTGRCSAPNYCSANNSIIFNKEIDGRFQLFSMSLDRFKGKNQKPLKTKQLTFGSKNKIEPVWHESGNFATFVIESESTGSSTEKDSQIALLTLNDCSFRVLSKSKGVLGFPALTERVLY